MSRNGAARLVAALVLSVAIVVNPVNSNRSPALASAPASAARTSVQATPPRPLSALPRTSYIKPRREVFGYFNGSVMLDPTVGYTTWDFNNLTTLAFFGLHVNAGDGSFSFDSSWSQWNSSGLAGLVSAAHAAGVKVVPSILLHDFSSTQNGTVNTAMCQGLATTAALHTIGDIASEVRAKGADGVNIDYEGSDQLCPNGLHLHTMLDSMMQYLRAAMPSAYISIATYNASYQGGYFDLAGLNPYVDSFFVMDYDSDSSNYHSEPLVCATYCFSPTAPLNTYYYNDTNSIAGYLTLVPASKVILGVPYYGYTACIPGANRPGPNAVPSTNTSLARWVAPRYVDSVAMNGSPDVYSYQMSRDVFTHSDPWSTWYSKNNGCWRESYWDDTVSLSAKYDLVNRYGLRGAGIFTLDYGGGSPELWQALKAKFGGCSIPTLTSSVQTPQSVGGTVTFSSAATCPGPIYAYWVQAPSGVWDEVRGFSSSGSWSWNTFGLVPGIYNVVVWVKQSYGDNSEYDTFQEMPYTFTGCATVGLDSTVPSPQAIGSALTFTGTTSGCTAPDFQFWIQASGGAWHVAQSYSRVQTLTWNTAGLVPGSYNLAVWVRQHGSGNVYDLGAGGPYVITGCATTSVSPAPGSYSVGGTIALTATPGGCPSPEFQFWVRAPGRTWSVARAYSPTATFDWSTTGLVPGQYQVAVWERQHGSGSPSGYDVATGGAYQLTGCPSLTMSTVPATTAARGTAVTVSALATGCSAPQYSFWFKPTSGGLWTQVPYGSVGSWSWSTAGRVAGTYYLLVMARQAGSGAAYDSGTYVVFRLT